MKKILTNKAYVAILAIIACVLWGSAFPVLKISYDELGILPNDYTGKIVLAGMRFFLASLILFIIAKFVLKISLKVEKRYIKYLVVLGLLQTTLQYFFFYIGLGNTTGMKGSILSSFETFVVVFFAHFIYKDDKINFQKTIGLITGFLGIIIVNWGKGFEMSFVMNGEGFMILSAVVSAGGVFMAKKLGKDINPIVITAWQMLIGSSFLIVYGMPKMSYESVTITSTAAMLFVYSAFLSAIAFAIWNSLLKYNKAGEITLFKFIVPISGTVLSAMFLPDEQFNIKIVIALILVASGILFVNYTPKKKKEIAIQ